MLSLINSTASKVISGSTKVVDFGTNRKRVFDFLLVINSIVSEIWPLKGRKSRIRTHPTLIQRPRSEWTPSSFGMNLISLKTRIMELPYGEETMIVGRTVWTQSTSVIDSQTDRITMTKTAQRIWRRAVIIRAGWRCGFTNLVTWVTRPRPWPLGVSWIDK